MKKILIIGARGYGRECFDGLKQYPQYGKDYIVKGFLDDKTDALDNFYGYPNIISSVENYQIQENDIFFCALGNVHYKAKYIEMIERKGGSFITIIHPTSIVYETAKIGAGVIISPYCMISANVIIDDFTTVQPFCNFGHDVKVGKFCAIESYSFMGGFVQLGDSVTLHTRSTILPHVKIGNNAEVGAGSVVIKDIKPDTTVFGVPAIKIKY